jgi:hypothetical protein
MSQSSYIIKVRDPIFCVMEKEGVDLGYALDYVQCEWTPRTICGLTLMDLSKGNLVCSYCLYLF